jgi:predicted nucleotidyltransferase
MCLGLWWKPDGILTASTFLPAIPTVLIRVCRRTISRRKTQKMQSVIRKESYGSVKVFWLDKPELARRIECCVSALASKNPKVREVILFGSVAEGRALPSSDVDLVIVLDRVKKRRLDRASEFTDYFAEVGLGVDLFILTVDEIERDDPPIYRNALRSGSLIYRRGDDRISAAAACRSVRRSPGP